MVLDTKTPLLARLLLVAIVVSFAAVIARDALGVVPPVLANVWDKAYNAVEFLALLVCALRARGSTGTERGAWIALCTGILGFFAADLYYTFVLADMASPPFPSWADAGYLVIYPTGYVALVLLLRARAGRISSALWLDGLVCALAVAALGAALVLGVVASTDGSLATVATNLGYPLGDLALLAFVTAVITVTGRKAGMTWWLVAAGFGVFAVADTVYLYEVALGTYRENTLLDAGWPTAFMLLAFAAWQPARRLNARRLHGAGMLALPALSGVTSIGILVVDHYSHQNDAAVWLASAALCVIVVRFGVTFRENLRMLDASESEATTDALTGLANRRALGEDLAGAERPLVLALFDLDGFKSYNDTFGHPAGDALLERLGRNLAAALGDTGRAYRMGGDEFCVLAPAGPRDAELVMSAADALSERGGSFDIGCSYGLVRLDDGTDAVDGPQRADRRLYENKRSRRAGTAESVHRVLMGVVGEHDGELHHHVVGVARLAERVGREMGLGAADLVHVRRAAALHDIGKIAIPDDILHAPRPLTDDEWQYIRQHTVIGERIISAAPELAPVAEIVRSSHERWDGGGYPDGLAAHDIPLGARIVAVCDSWEAMTSSRAYRAAMSPTLAMHELTRCSGTQFDPRVVAAFVAVRQAASEDDVAGTTTSCATSATIS
jgi:two-component system, cell cycle response regulator